MGTCKMIKIIEIKPCVDPQYVKPKKLIFEKDGQRRDWEVVETHDSIAVLLYHKDKKAFVVVKQFRPAVYLKNGDGYTVELCAGLVDKDKPLDVITQEEILEECGYAVELKNIKKILSFYTAVGFAGGVQTLFFAQIDEDMRVNEGGGIDDEDIEVVYIPITDAKSFIFDDSIAKTPGLMYAFMWYFENDK